MDIDGFFLERAYLTQNSERKYKLYKIFKEKTMMTSEITKKKPVAIIKIGVEGIICMVIPFYFIFCEKNELI